MPSGIARRILHPSRRSVVHYRRQRMSCLGNSPSRIPLFPSGVRQGKRGWGGGNLESERVGIYNDSMQSRTRAGKYIEILVCLFVLSFHHCSDELKSEGNKGAWRRGPRLRRRTGLENSSISEPPANACHTTWTPSPRHAEGVVQWG